jgi:putative peptide zinc metalloprotease protein
LADDGVLRDMTYFVAVVSLVRSLFVNISPFMRFDGYYILSDLLDLPNLQSRAFELTRQNLRNILFGLDQPLPEQFSRRMAIFLQLYSWITWFYRLAVFLGIAFTVYHFFFKPLGILLFLVEVVYFIITPITRELAVWRKVFPMSSSRRKLIFATIALVVIVLTLVPLHSRVVLPAFVNASVKRVIYAPFPAKIDEVACSGGSVHKGQLLFRLQADESQYQSYLASMQAAELRDRVRRLSLSDQGLEHTHAWTAEARERDQRVNTHQDDLQRLQLKADFDGELLDVDTGVRPGVYVSPRDLLGVLIDPGTGEVEAFASESELAGIREGSQVVFWPSAADGVPIKGYVTAIDRNRVSVLPTPALADTHGGVIQTQHRNDRPLAPVASLYRIRIKPVAGLRVQRLQLGRAVIEGEQRSLAGRLFRYALSVIIRESGF